MTRGLGKKEKHDIRVLARFIEIFCRSHHREGRRPFLFNVPGKETLFRKPPDSARTVLSLLKYGLTMRLRCPHEPKPLCKKCSGPCYKPEYREKIREVMRFSGMYLVKRGRIDLIFHYFR